MAGSTASRTNSPSMAERISPSSFTDCPPTNPRSLESAPTKSVASRASRRNRSSPEIFPTSSAAAPGLPSPFIRLPIRSRMPLAARSLGIARARGCASATETQTTHTTRNAEQTTLKRVIEFLPKTAASARFALPELVNHGLFECTIQDAGKLFRLPLWATISPLAVLERTASQRKPAFIGSKTGWPVH